VERRAKYNLKCISITKITIKRKYEINWTKLNNIQDIVIKQIS